MGKILVKARKKILVKDAKLMYNARGEPSFMFGSGGGGRGGGKTKRQKILGGLGGAVGVLGALTGKHRSLGGLAGSMYAGGVQGRSIGEGLGRGLTRRGRQARADLQEKEKQEYADMRAQRQAQGKDVDSPFVGVLPNIRGTPVKGDEARRANMGKWAAEDKAGEAAGKLRTQQEKLTSPEQYDLDLQAEIRRRRIREQAKLQSEGHSPETGYHPFTGAEPGTAEAMRVVNPMNATTQTIPVNGNMSTPVDNLNNVDPNYKDSDGEYGGHLNAPPMSSEVSDEEQKKFERLKQMAAQEGMTGWSSLWERGLNEDGAQ